MSTTASPDAHGEGRTASPDITKFASSVRLVDPQPGLLQNILIPSLLEAISSQVFTTAPLCTLKSGRTCRETARLSSSTPQKVRCGHGFRYKCTKNLLVILVDNAITFSHCHSKLFKSIVMCVLGGACIDDGCLVVVAFLIGKAEPLWCGSFSSLPHVTPSCKWAVQMTYAGTIMSSRDLLLACSSHLPGRIQKRLISGS